MLKIYSQRTEDWRLPVGTLPIERTINEWAHNRLFTEKGKMGGKKGRDRIISHVLKSLKPFEIINFLLIHDERIGSESAKYIAFYNRLITGKFIPSFGENFYSEELIAILEQEGGDSKFDLLNRPYKDPHLETLVVSKEIGDGLKKTKKGEKFTQYMLSKYLHSMFLSNSLVFNEKNNELMFLHFGYVRNKFEKIYNELENIFLNNTGKFDLNSCLFSVKEVVDTITLDFGSNVFKKDRIDVEPITYKLCDFVIKMMLDIRDNEEISSDKAIVVLRKFVEEYLEMAKKLYQEEIIKWPEVQRIEIDAIHGIYPELDIRKDIPTYPYFDNTPIFGSIK